MKNIIWQKPDGGFAVTSLYDITVDSAEHAAQIKAAGSIPAEWVIHAIDAATPPQPLSEVKAAKLDQLTISRDAATIANVIAHGRQWQADERSQKLLSAAITLAMAGAPLPPVWRDANNSNMPITTLAELVAIAGAMARQTQAAYSKSWTLKDQVDAAQTPGAVDAVVW